LLENDSTCKLAANFDAANELCNSSAAFSYCGSAASSGAMFRRLGGDVV
jgi:hypothetical protein